ncbi:uncharacterized protein TNCV_5126511 [Trichonephila clavipes]|nr:uncharacterized protein TNCV_5126511 [Trichonephila clavipes]
MCVGCLPTNTEIEIGEMQKWWTDKMIEGIVIEELLGMGSQRNQGFESRNRFDRDNRRFHSNNGRHQSRNRGSRENFSRRERRHGGPLNSSRVQVDQYDQAQTVRNPPIKLSAICMSPVELPYVPILLNETFTKALTDTGVEKSFISEEAYKKYLFYKPVRKSRTEVVTAQGGKC